MLRFLVYVAFAAFAGQLATAADKFSCEGRASGYYADLGTGCQVYHMCDGLGRQFSYSCPNTTLFQQRMLICDHWYMVNCSKSENDYNANLLIGQRDKPFVEDSSEHPYHRTPRPDLLQQPYAPRYQDDKYRQGRVQNLPASLNLVGVATDEEEDEYGNPRRNYTTDRPQYFLPSHWSTQYGKGLTTPIPLKASVKLNKYTGTKSSTVDRKGPPSNINYDSKQYKTSFVQKNPVLPENPVPVLPPVPSGFKNNQVNTFSPVLPSVPPPRTGLPSLPSGLKNNQFNTFSTNNRAGTSNIPDAVNEASVSPSSLALPPFAATIDRNDDQPTIVQGTKDQSNIPKPSLFYQPPKFSSTFNAESTTMDPQTFYKLVPSKDLLPPILSKTNKVRSSTVSPPQRTTTQKTINKKDIESTEKSDTDNRWKELRHMFFIPEYDFPLEAVSRPSYEGGLSSFQVNPAPPNPEARIRDNSSGSTSSNTPNPDCPKCDPAFLAPGTCKPCVMIRR